MRKPVKVVIAGELARDYEDNVCVRCRWRELYPQCPAHPDEPDEDWEFERKNGEWVLAVDYIEEWREKYGEFHSEEGDTWRDSRMFLCDDFEEMLWVEG